MFSSGSVWDYWPLILLGLQRTVLISLLAMLAGGVIGVLVGTGRSYGARPVRLFCRCYTEAFRSVPPLLLFFGTYFGLSYATGLQLSPFAAAVGALSAEASSLLSECVRAAWQSVGAAQWDAARALGLPFWPTLRLVVLPQARRVLLPPVVGVLVAVLKDSSFASIVGLAELTRSSLMVRETTGDNLTVFLLLGGAYFVLNASISAIGSRLERRSPAGA